MIFTKDENAQKNLATIPGHQGNESYECIFAMCDNPLCTCNTIPVWFGSISPSSEEIIPASYTNGITVNIETRQVEFESNAAETMPGDTDFLQRVCAHLQEEDYQFLAQEYTLYTREMTEQVDIASLDSDFPIKDIERNNTMLGYTDVLPYGANFMGHIHYFEGSIRWAENIIPPKKLDDSTSLRSPWI